MEEKVYEQCNHKWKTIEINKEFIAREGNGIFTDIVDHYKKVFIQKCINCGKIQKVS